MRNIAITIVLLLPFVSNGQFDNGTFSRMGMKPWVILDFDHNGCTPEYSTLSNHIDRDSTLVLEYACSKKPNFNIYYFFSWTDTICNKIKMEPASEAIKKKQIEKMNKEYIIIDATHWRYYKGNNVYLIRYAYDSFIIEKEK